MLTEWNQLVKSAIDNDDGFDIILKELEPSFIAISRTLNYDSAELVQVARIALWKSLGKVDLNKPKTIKAYLIMVGVNAMKDVLRYRNRNELLESVRGTEVSFSQFRFEGLLADYAKCITETGQFKGTHEIMAKKFKVSTWTMRRKFHEAVKFFLEENND